MKDAVSKIKAVVNWLFDTENEVYPVETVERSDEELDIAIKKAYARMARHRISNYSMWNMFR